MALNRVAQKGHFKRLDFKKVTVFKKLDVDRIQSNSIAFEYLELCLYSIPLLHTSCTIGHQVCVGVKFTLVATHLNQFLFCILKFVFDRANLSADTP